jgi:hypothetical protein
VGEPVFVQTKVIFVASTVILAYLNADPDVPICTIPEQSPFVEPPAVAMNAKMHDVVVPLYVPSEK